MIFRKSIEPGIFEVEFSANNGHAYAIATLKEKQLWLLNSVARLTKLLRN